MFPPYGMPGGDSFQADDGMSYEEETLYDRNGNFGTQEMIHHPDGPDQHDPPMDFTILGSPEDESTHHTQDLYPSSGELLGMTGGSDVSTNLTQTMGSTSLHLHPFDNPPAIERNEQDWGSSEETQPLYNFQPPRVTVQVSGYDDEAYLAPELWRSAPENYAADFVTVSGFDQRMQPRPGEANSSQFLSLPYNTRTRPSPVGGVHNPPSAHAYSGSNMNTTDSGMGHDSYVSHVANCTRSVVSTL